MSATQPLHDEAQFLIIQQHQLTAAAAHLGDMTLMLDRLHGAQREHGVHLQQMLLDAETMARGDADLEIDIDIDIDIDSIDVEIDVGPDSALPGTSEPSSFMPLPMLDHLQIDAGPAWNLQRQAIDAYVSRNNLSMEGDPFSRLMSDSQRIAVEKRIRDEFSVQGACCDKYDYMTAATCGLIGALMDILFVRLPGHGALSKLSDGATDRLVEKFAGLCGWQGGANAENVTASAIGFLERKFRVNYDQATGAAVGGAFKMRTENHHVKNLAHSPDLIGLFFSILNQFTSTASFIADGRLITIDTDTFELQGGNLIAKIFAGFVNWLGHLFSDMAGSSGAAGRGSGIPIPFYSLLQLINVGEFGQHRQTFATLAVRVFEQGYDLRHGFALAVPVLVTELLTRMMWSIKQAFYHQRPLLQCLPSAANPELRRMLMIGHGTLCLVDAADAGIRSGGDIVQFLLRSNLIAWARFGTLALKELRVLYAQGDMDFDVVDDYLDREYARMLA